MTTCANCTADAKYDYVGIKYCREHLPKFLVNKDGSVAAPEIAKIVDLTSRPSLPIVFPTAEEYNAEVAAAEEAAKPAPGKRKAKTTKAVEEEPVVEDVPVEEAPAEEAVVEE